MKNTAKTSKVTVAGVVGLTAAGIAATIVLANGTAADTSDSRSVELPQSAPAQNYMGPRSADAAEGWLESKMAYIESKQAYTGPMTPDAAEVWIESGTVYRGPRTADAAEHWIAASRD